MWRAIGHHGQLEDVRSAPDSGDDEIVKHIARTGSPLVRTAPGGRRLEVVLNPSLIDPVQHSALLYLLADSEAVTARVAIVDDAELELNAKPLALVSQVNRLIGTAKTAIEKRFSSAPVALGRRSAVSEIATELRHETQLTSNVRKVLSSSFADRFVLIERSSDGELYLEDLGSGMPVLRAAAKSYCLPMALRLLPDLAYGRWIEKQMRSTLEKGQTENHKVSLQLKWLGQDRAMKFVRHALPFGSATDQLLVITQPLPHQI